MNTIELPDAQSSRLRVLLIGPMPIPNDHIGGAKAAFAQMVDDFVSMSTVDVDLINLSRPLGFSRPLRRIYLNFIGLIKTLWSMANKGRQSDVWVLNVSPIGSFTLLPIVMLLAKLYRKPVLMRMFGGSFVNDHNALNSIRRYMYDKALSACSIVTMETKQLMENTSAFDNIAWFPNTRNNPMPPNKRNKCENLLFLSQIRTEKGVGEIINALAHLSDNITIDFYGSVVDSELVKTIERTTGLAYKGEIKPEQVYSVLSQYDALLLPSYWPGEGLPGVIVEAFQSGMPVIATDWKQIPELVTHEHDGLLVKPKCSISLAAAIDRLIGSEHEYRQFCSNAIATGNLYRSDKWNDTLYHWCLEAHKHNSFKNNRVL